MDRKNLKGYPPVVMPSCHERKVLKGQKALVTGAASGIGRAIAASLGRSGADVMVNYYRRKDEAEDLARLIRSQGSQSIIFKADISSEAQVRDMFAATTEAFGSLDILINNAGIQIDSPFDEMELKDWQRVLDVNLTGQFLCAREAVKLFKKKGVQPDLSCAAGKIIFISSVHEVIPWAGHVNYAASKGGVMLLMKSIAQEVAPYRIRVNSIAPGAIKTAINQVTWGNPETYQDLMGLIPYKRIGEADEIGRAAVWLASDESDYVTGISLYVDGGMTLYPGFETGG